VIFASDTLMVAILRSGVGPINKRIATGQVRSKPSSKALGLVLALSLGLSVFAHGQERSEVSRAESGFAGRSLAEVNLALATMRPERVSESDKVILTRVLPVLTDRNRVVDARQLALLSARTEATLRFCQRYGVVDLILFRHSEPIVFSKPGVVLGIATELLKIVGDDDAALAGIVAHELAHEYIALQMLSAVRAGDLSKMRELELFCDAVAVIVLLDLSLDPVHYSRVLKRIARHSPASTALNNGSSTHPAIEQRLQVILDISNLFKSEAAVARLRKLP
jgi:Zn-dependent protease with chaperone function